MSVPADLKYTDEHEWVRIEQDHAVIGITDHAQQQLGDVVYVDLPEVGKKLAKGDTFGSVESVKAVSDLFSPVAGVVTATNGDLVKGPDAVNTDPYGKAWMIKIKLGNPSEAQSLLSSAAYDKLLASLA